MSGQSLSLTDAPVSESRVTLSNVENKTKPKLELKLKSE